MPNIIDQYTRHAHYLEQYYNGQADTVNKFLRRIAKRLRLELTKTQTVNSQRRIESLLTFTEELVNTELSAFTEAFSEQLELFAISEAEFSAGVLKTLDTTIPSPLQIMMAINARPFNNRLLKDYLEAFSIEQAKAVRSAVAMGFYEGQTTQQIVQGIAGTRSQNYKNGLLNVSRTSAERMVRTSLSHTSSVAKSTFFEENKDLVPYYEWVSTLDGRTSATCFTGKTTVNPVSRIEKLYRADYNGEIITLNFANGDKIEGTPNHPILTQKGWTPLYEVDPSKHVVYTVCDDGIEILRKKNVSVKTTFSELFDSLSKTPIVDVIVKRASTADFYGDGVGMDGEVRVLSVNKGLWGNIKACTFETIKNKFFSFIHNPSGFSSFCRVNFLFWRFFIPVKPAKIESGNFSDMIECGFRYPSFFKYFNRSSTFLKKLYRLILSKLNFIGDMPSPVVFHEANLFQETSNSSSSGVVGFSDASSGITITIKPCDIIGKSSEFKFCHVYTLQTGQGYYTAGGSIVKNCRALDGEVFKAGKGRLPPAHYNCRSTTSPLFKEDVDSKGDKLKLGGKRASKDGQVSADLNYNDWLKNQSKSFQVDVLGETRAELFRKGGLTMDKFVNNKGQLLTLDQLKTKYASAWAKL